MTILKEVLAELFSMFVSDARLTLAILLVVGLSALLISVVGVAPLAVGVFLVLGCVAVLVMAVRREAARRNTLP